MARKKSNITSDKLVESIIGGIQEKKGEKIVSLNLGRIKNAICQYFVICQGNSNTQVEAIAYGLKEHVRNTLDVKPWHSEGFENAEWILLDYVDVVVHVFQPHTREYYKLEELWADAELKEYSDVH